MAGARQCMATTKTGIPCRVRAGDDGWCPFHHPQRAERMAQVRQQGGQASSNGARARKLWREAGVTTAEDVLATIVIATQRVLEGEIEPAVGGAVASLSRAWFAGRTVILTEDLERRIGELEAAMKGQAR